MSDETNSESGTTKPYAEMTPAERSRLMDFILQQQAQFFTDIEALKELQARNAHQIKGMLRLIATPDPLLVRARSVLGRVIVKGARERTRIRTHEAEISALIQVQAHNEALAQRNGEQIAALREGQAATAALIERNNEQTTALIQRNNEQTTALVQRNSESIAELRQAHEAQAQRTDAQIAALRQTQADAAQRTEAQITANAQAISDLAALVAALVKRDEPRT